MVVYTCFVLIMMMMMSVRRSYKRGSVVFDSLPSDFASAYHVRSLATILSEISSSSLSAIYCSVWLPIFPVAAYSHVVPYLSFYFLFL